MTGCRARSARVGSWWVVGSCVCIIKINRVVTAYMVFAAAGKLFRWAFPANTKNTPHNRIYSTHYLTRLHSPPPSPAVPPQPTPPSPPSSPSSSTTRHHHRHNNATSPPLQMGASGLLRQCPHHGFSELHQLDTFYNSLNTNDQDALDSAAGGNFLDKMPREGLAIIESKSKVLYSRSRPNDSRAITNAPSSTSSPSNNSFEIQQMAALLEDKINIRMSRLEKAISEKNATTPATVKAVEEVCVTCGSNHNFNNCPLTRNEFPVFHDNFHQFQQTAAVGNFVQRNPPNLANQIRPPGVSKTDFKSYAKANDANMNNLQMKLDNFQRNQNDFQRVYNDSQKKQDDFQNLMLGFMQNYHNNSTASTSNPGTLPSQTITNPRQQINAITTRSGKILEGPLTPPVPIPVVSIPSKEPEQNPETSTEKVQNPNLENTAHVPPQGEEDSIFIEIPKPKAKKTINVEIQDLNSPSPTSYQSKLPYPERMKVRENDKPSAQHSRFLKMFKQLRLEIGLKDALVEMPKFNKWLSSLLRNKEKLEEIAITTVNAECSAIIMNKVPEKLEDPGKFLIPCALQELNRTSALADSRASVNLLPHSIYKKLGLEALTPTRMTLELANRSITHPMGIAKDVVVRVDGFTFLTDFVEELVYYADKSEKNKDKNFVHAISIIDFSKDDPFSGNTTNTLPHSSSPVKASDNLEKFADELAPLDSLPPGNDDSTLKKDLHEENFQVYSNLLFEFDDNFKSSNVNPLFEENDKDVKIKSSSSFTLTSPELILPSLPPLQFQVAILLPLLSSERRKKIICRLATFLHKKPKPLSRPQEVAAIKIEEDKVSSPNPINTIVMPIRITFDNPIDFNDHFSKPKDLKKDLAVAFDSTESSILPPPLLDFDSPFTAELSASVTLNSLGNEDKVFKPGILVYHAIHDKNLVPLEKNLKENISSRTLLVFNESYFLLPPPKPPDDSLNFEPNLVMRNVVLNEDFYKTKKTLPLNVEDVNSFAFVMWTFLPYFTYTKESPLIFSFRGENFVFDPGIVTFHISYLNPVAFSTKVFHLLSLRTN
ncbi:reverse transcriptase domain-containing protein [Tanacetum coccineum]|uniref:Reverse transcriptase domain-containing protein n=1 Tax=Tanacetum coccineum TaxID=301880 RepID=A0ABQ5D3H1_9ASTR